MSKNNFSLLEKHSTLTLFLLKYLLNFIHFFLILSTFCSATIQNDPFIRMREVVRWYLSGFYKKPNGWLI